MSSTSSPTSSTTASYSSSSSSSASILVSQPTSSPQPSSSLPPTSSLTDTILPISTILPVTTASTTSTTSAPPLPTTTTLECHSIYVDPDGTFFRIYCNADITGPNLTVTTAPSFSTCIVLCDSFNSTCTAAVYSNTTNPPSCTLKAPTLLDLGRRQGNLKDEVIGKRQMATILSSQQNTFVAYHLPQSDTPAPPDPPVSSSSITPSTPSTSSIASTSSSGLPPSMTVGMTSSISGGSTFPASSMSASGSLINALPSKYLDTSDAYRHILQDTVDLSHSGYAFPILTSSGKDMAGLFPTSVRV
ncbi:hypothetical protein MMC19_000863 [Ptychographa xylographoides]|nr:hypothetical protein [Ptychographa xylographoides]